MSSSRRSQDESERLAKIELVKAALKRIIRTMNEPSTVGRLAEEQKKGEDVLAHMQYVFPLLTEVMAAVINEYGYARNGEGVIEFTLLAKQLEKNDQEICDLNATLQSYFLPKIGMCPRTETASQ